MQLLQYNVCIVHITMQVLRSFKLPQILTKVMQLALTEKEV